jgi:hypothetical protein
MRARLKMNCLIMSLFSPFQSRGQCSKTGRVFNPDPARSRVIYFFFNPDPECYNFFQSRSRGRDIPCFSRATKLHTVDTVECAYNL